MHLSPEELSKFAGRYRGEDREDALEIVLEADHLSAVAPGRPPLLLKATGPATFAAVEFPGLTFTFAGRGGLVERLIRAAGGQESSLVRMPEGEAAPAEPSPEPTPEPTTAAEAREEPVPRRPPLNWPSFRGPGASGIGDGQGIPWQWDGETGVNVRWKTPIPGIALSSPIVWGDRVFVTTAAAEDANTSFRTGLYGDVDSVEDDAVHSFRVYALDRRSGEILWQREAAQGRPKVKRHGKSSHANPTPATDGRHLVVSFGSEGLFCYDLAGNLLWKKDLGVLVSGWFYDPTYEWGFASSPILHRDRVLVQVDIQEGSFLAAFDLATGKEVWRTTRQEIPSWATPAVLPAAEVDGPDEIITNAPTVRGYDAATGRELWTLTPNSEIVVATPVVADGVAYVTGGYPPARPVYAIRPGGRGDLSLADGQTSSPHILWSEERGGTYIPTPIVYRDVLYLLNNNGRLAAYEARTGELLYRERVGRGESFSGSPV
ncbi:MAG: PQQ-like beta-propeller repeat protein, partial [Acidobacteria bacterium]|nr:PQQ-like beta-propeller repeat protein [Acidobacteriota bacterium]